MTDSISAVVVSRVVQTLITFCRAGTALCDFTFSHVTSDSGEPRPDFKLLLSHVCFHRLYLFHHPSILLPLLSKWAWLNLESSALLVIGIVNQFIPRWNGSRSSEDQPALAEHSTCDWVSLDNRHHHSHLNQNNDKDVLIYMSACVFACCVFGSAEQADLSIVAERCVGVCRQGPHLTWKSQMGERRG